MFFFSAEIDCFQTRKPGHACFLANSSCRRTIVAARRPRKCGRTRQRKPTMIAFQTRYHDVFRRRDRLRWWRRKPTMIAFRTHYGGGCLVRGCPDMVVVPPRQSPLAASLISRRVTGVYVRHQQGCVGRVYRHLQVAFYAATSNKASGKLPASPCPALRIATLLWFCTTTQSGILSTATR